MKFLDSYMKNHKHALSLHRTLMLALAQGNAEEASEVAGALASAIRRHRQSLEDPQAPHSGSTSQPTADLPPFNIDAVEPAMQRTIEGVVPSSSSSNSDTVRSSRDNGEDLKAPWNSSANLTITLLESSYETTAPDEEGDGEGQQHKEERDLALLDEYLLKEAARWKAQKHAVAKAVLEAARRVGITPLQLHAGEGAASSSSSSSLNPLRHCNVIIRGEVPDPDGPDIDTELQELEVHLQTKLDDKARDIARMELLLSRRYVRYVVGLHRTLSTAIDAAAPEASSTGTDGDASLPPTKALTDEIMRVLNQVPSGAEDVVHTTIAVPVIPFTFMLKLCLWYEVKL